MSQTYIYDIGRLTGCIVSSFASALNLLLIWDMGIWNAHIMLIASMTAYQLIYDVSFYTIGTSVPGSPNYIWALVAQVWGGCTSSIMSNFMLYSVLHIMTYYKTSAFILKGVLVNLLANFPALLVNFIYFGSLGKNNAYLLLVANYMYYYIRLISIFINFILLAYIYYRMYVISSMRGTGNVQDKAIRSLIDRLKYYPLVQTISRAGYSWYEQAYGFDFDVSDTSSPQFFGAQCVVAFITPLGAIGYFIIFLAMQPTAFRNAISRITTCKRYEPPQKHREVFTTVVNALGGGHPKATTIGANFTTQFVEESDDNVASAFDARNYNDQELFEVIDTYNVNPAQFSSFSSSISSDDGSGRGRSSLFGVLGGKIFTSGFNIRASQAKLGHIDSHVDGKSTGAVKELHMEDIREKPNFVDSFESDRISV